MYVQDKIVANIPMGILTKNTQCHEKLSVIKPPNVGPNVGPKIIPIPKIALAVLILLGGKAPMIIVCAVESNPPPPKPCTKRQKTSIQRLVEKPHIREANVKITTDAVK